MARDNNAFGSLYLLGLIHNDKHVASSPTRSLPLNKSLAPQISHEHPFQHHSASILSKESEAEKSTRLPQKKKEKKKAAISQVLIITKILL